MDFYTNLTFKRLRFKGVWLSEMVFKFIQHYYCIMLVETTHLTQVECNVSLADVRYGMVWYGILEFNVPLDTV